MKNKIIAGFCVVLLCGSVVAMYQKGSNVNTVEANLKIAISKKDNDKVKEFVQGLKDWYIKNHKEPGRAIYNIKKAGATEEQAQRLFNGESINDVLGVRSPVKIEEPIIGTVEPKEEVVEKEPVVVEKEPVVVDKEPVEEEEPVKLTQAEIKAKRDLIKQQQKEATDLKKKEEDEKKALELKVVVAGDSKDALEKAIADLQGDEADDVLLALKAKYLALPKEQQDQQTIDTLNAII